MPLWSSFFSCSHCGKFILILEISFTADTLLSISASPKTLSISSLIRAPTVVLCSLAFSLSINAVSSETTIFNLFLAYTPHLFILYVYYIVKKVICQQDCAGKDFVPVSRVSRKGDRFRQIRSCGIQYPVVTVEEVDKNERGGIIDVINKFDNL